MKKRINSTGRQKLPLECITIRLIEPTTPDLPRSFSATFALPASLAEEPGSALFVEAYVRSSVMRFPWGTVGEIRPPPTTALSNLDPGPILFRVKVVDGAVGAGRIVAAAERIRPYEEIDDGDSRKSLLPLVQRDLGERVWMLDTTDGARPVLAINNRVPAIRDRLMADPIMRGAVFPQAVQGVFEAILLDDEINEDDNWVHDWTRFGTDLLGHELPEDLNPQDDREELERLVQELVDAFVDKLSFVKKAQQSAEGDLL